MLVEHPLKPIYNSESKVLILGTMPSIKSRERNFYYAHPQNRFWKTLSKVFDEPIGETNEERINFLLTNHIALFDVLKSCDILSSSDSTIKNPIPNDLTLILKTNIQSILLPSPSPANCPKGIEEKLYNEYSKIKDYISS